jgi:AP2 domain
MPNKRQRDLGASFTVYAKRKRWRARVYVRGRSVQLGYFATREEAVREHADAVKKYLGDGFLKGIQIEGAAE